MWKADIVSLCIYFNIPENRVNQENAVIADLYW